MANYTLAKTAFSRVFLLAGRAGPETAPEYQSCLRSAGVEQSFGDVTRIECPSPDEYGQFLEIDRIQGAISRATSSLMGRYAADLASALLELARQRCAVDVQVHFGKCTDPRVFNTFTKALVWEDVILSSYSTEDLGALGSDENAAIMETSSLSIGQFYEVLPLTIQERAKTLVTNPLVDAIVCDLRTCGECGTFSDGCHKAFVLQGGVAGSPGTAPDVLYTGTKGAVWGTDEITSLEHTETANAIACLGPHVIVVSNDAGSLHYKDKETLLAGTGGEWTEVLDGFEPGGEPNDIWSVGDGVFIVGDGGHVYYCTDPAAGVVVLDAGTATAQDLNAVHALSSLYAVAVGDNDAVIYTRNGIAWGAAPGNPGSGDDLTAVWMRTESEWWVTTDDGELYYTRDYGVTWHLKALPGANIAELHDIQFVTPSVGYVAGGTSTLATVHGALWRTYDGGHSWVRLPEGAGTLVGNSAMMNALGGCVHDPNFIIGAGETAGGADGVLLVGED